MPTTFDWTPSATPDHVTWRFATIPTRDHGEGDGPLALVAVTGPGIDCRRPERAHQPLVEVRTADDGGRLPTGSRIGQNLRLTNHTIDGDSLEIVQDDPVSGVRAVTMLRSSAAGAALTATTTLTLNEGHAPLRLWSVTSVATGVLISEDVNHLEVWSGRNGWAAEHRWSAEPLRAPRLARTDPTARGETCRDSLRRTGSSSMSTARWVPAGVASHAITGASLAWQVEHHGAWSWEVAEAPVWGEFARVGEDEPIGRPMDDRSRDGASLVLQGPSDGLHQWNLLLDSGASFTTVPATIAVGTTRDDALGALARSRRDRLRPPPTGTDLPVVFNDYMDTLEGDPTEAKLLPLIDAAAEVGADIFCIDAGWYDDTDGWWASVGDWQPSTARFPRGLAFVLDHIRSRGMVAGLWMEPEVVGVTSRAAATLPPEAFMVRDGVRLTENSRHFLDFRSPAARDHVDAAIDRLVGELGVGFFKFDHNCTPGSGTDGGGDEAVGAQLLQHQRSFLQWLDDLLDRHPDLVIESCASGAMRSDFAMLQRLHLQSTSDQQDPLLYPAIAVGALAHILPEQAGNWAYPQATMTDEQIVFTMCTGMAGRVYQAGLLDRMNQQQKQLVADAIRVHRELLPVMATSIPRFPTGLPSWDDGWTAVCFDADDDQVLIAWRQAWADLEVQLALPHLGDGDLQVEQVYPLPGGLPAWTVDRVNGGLLVTADEEVAAARVWRVRTAGRS